ncbi:hypothetical protein AKJ65_07220 [candidate division MSBL1 archaeon SCGC-AAA259E19]|uniref:Aminotransferase n=2 Tax=candidate division MSBL1 TaxID=215777 RepID=A0A133V5V2_9EURY|nr:hypothetical protein AKJ65_07220 [candidate division MSBL1 archaeon SCGC-AAA259E19]KXB01815.1 hypothetical protein AKJ41_00145 [candidate division MSBL1 archaeon SCGC-AAA259O05]
MTKELLREETKNAKELFHGDKVLRAGKKEVKEVIDFSTNTNPYGPPPELLRKIGENLEKISTYPPHQPRNIRKKIAEHCDSTPEKIVLGNGCNELIYLIARSFLSKEDETVTVEPTYTEYSKAAKLQGSTPKAIRLREEESFELEMEDLKGISEETKLVFLCSPNNPTGNLHKEKVLEGAAEICEEKKSLLVLDESFIEFTGREREYGPIHGGSENVIVLRSLTKFYSIPGLRVGYAVAPKPIAQSLRKAQPQWNVNGLSLLAAGEAVKSSKYRGKTRAKIRKNGTFLSESLSRLGVNTYPWDANFLLSDFSSLNTDAQNIAKKLLEKGIGVRMCDDFKFLDKNYIRMSFRPKKECEKLIESLKEIL